MQSKLPTQLGQSDQSLFAVYSKTSVLNVLVLVPWPDSRPYAGWDGGLDLLPGARIAIQEINNRSDILREYTITAIEAMAMQLVD